MSIVQEADQGYNVPSAQTNTLIGSFTAPSGTDFLIFACSLYTSAGRQVTGLQFNGDAASKHDDFSPTVNGNMGSSIWYLANPDTGSSYEIRWWSSGAATVGDLLAIALSGVDLTTPFGTAAKAEGSTGTDGTVDVASTSDGLVIDVYSGRKTVTVGSGQTEY